MEAMQNVGFAPFLKDGLRSTWRQAGIAGFAQFGDVSGRLNRYRQLARGRHSLANGPKPVTLRFFNELDFHDPLCQLNWIILVLIQSPSPIHAVSICGRQSS